MFLLDTRVWLSNYEGNFHRHFYLILGGLHQKILTDRTFVDLSYKLSVTDFNINVINDLTRIFTSFFLQDLNILTPKKE